MLDLLSTILTNLSMRGTLYFRTAFSGAWGVAVPAYENVARFHYVQSGSCLVRVEGQREPVALSQGDLIIIPHGAAHDLISDPGATRGVLPLDEVLSRAGYDGKGVLIYGDAPEADADTQLICGHFAFEPHARHILMERLPPALHVRDYGAHAGAWMEATLGVLGAEAESARMGGDLIALKMSEVILAHAIRSFLESNDAPAAGLAGFSDAHLSRALDAVHRAPRTPWTVERLAQEAGMSRTAFAVLFQKKMGLAPMEYVTLWRMEVAKRLLAEPRHSLIDVAEGAGYASESAFGRVFKKETGFTPAGFRRMAMAEMEPA